MALTQVNSAGIKDGEIVNADVNASAAIAKSKLAGLDIVNADVNASAAIAKSKLAGLDIVNADVNASAAIAGSKLAAATTSAAGSMSAADKTKLDGVAASANNYTHPNHSGEVTSTADGATVIADDVVDEANLKISNAGSNGQFLSKQSGDTGGLTWATVDTSLADNSVTLAKMAGLARGKIIYGDASGDPAALTVGSASTYLKSDGTDISWASLSSPMFAAGKVALIQHQTSGTTGGGSTTSGSYNTVPWTNETLDPGGIVSLSSNEITIGPGTYQMFANHLFYRTDTYVWGLKITSASGDHYWGTAGFAGNGDYDEQVAHCYCRHINDTGGDETMIAHYRCQTAQSDDGLGRGNSFGAGNVLGQWWILKEA